MPLFLFIFCDKYVQCSSLSRIIRHLLRLRNARTFQLLPVALAGQSGPGSDHSGQEWQPLASEVCGLLRKIGP